MAALSQKRSCGQIMNEFGEFMWNPRTREFMGRTASSWVLIVTFYVVFYAFLTGMFALSIWVMLQTIDDYTPKYWDRLSSPGLMIRPKTDSLEIVYNINDTGNSGWGAYVAKLNSALEVYNDSVQMQQGSVCNQGVFNKQDNMGDVKNNHKKACQFLRSSLGNCSGLDDPTYGYKDGSPCVLIKMNRIINFLPGVIPSLSNSSITINCTGKTTDTELMLGRRTYYPSNGTVLGTMDLMYFPYYGKKAQTNYTQPLVAVQFHNVTQNQDLFVECRANAANINSNDDRDKFSGRVTFKLRINK
uniref:Sodium/potassium-transporting ATPase subunit beta n=1 Tax=Xenopus laevis TaxID=8355 RepID=Q9DGK9_XENLA|nr:Na/K ATPase beta subunit [Xenopus laevis]